MLFLQKMKDLRIYKKPFYLPTSSERDKKKKSAILLLTPNYISSLSLMQSPLTVNKLRYQSYYLKKDVAYYINGKNAKAEEDDDYVREATIEEIYQGLHEMTAAERNKLKDSDFGIPSKRKYPLDTEAHVRSAIRFFNYVDKEDEVELAGNINKAIKRFNITDIHVGKKNRFYKYYKPINESADMMEDEDTITLVDNLSSFIAFSGFIKDIAEIKETITPDFYFNLLQNLNIDIKSVQDIPILMVNVGIDREDTTDYDSGVYKVYPINIDNCESIDKKVYTQFIENLNPNLKGTIVPAMVADELLGLASYTTNYIKCLFDNGLSIKDIISIKDIAELVIILKSKFGIGEDDLRTPNKELLESYTSLYEDDYTLDASLFNEADVKDADGLILNDTVYFFSESKVDDTNLKRFLYTERLKKRADLLNLLEKVKLDTDGMIKFAFPDLRRYQSKNIFYDVSYYNQLFFKNSNLSPKKAYATYLVLMDRFINDPDLKVNGYEKKTVFIPITDWTNDRRSRMWLYRENMNPISIIYDMIYNGSPQLKQIFGDTDVIFFGRDKYFKINFANIEDMKERAIKFKLFISKIVRNEEFSPEDEDTSMDNKEDSKTIQTNIVDNIELTTGVDLTAKVVDANEKLNKDMLVKQPFHNYEPKKTLNKPTTAKPIPKQAKETESDKELKQDIKFNNINLAKDANTDKLKDQEAKLNDISKRIATATYDSKSEEDSKNELANDDKFKELLTDINSIASDDSNVDISATRAARLNELNNKFLGSTINDKTVKDILDGFEKIEEKPLKETDLKISSPNKEWSKMTYMNFDKDYDLDADIVAAFYHFTKVSRPLGIRSLKSEDVSTSEDAIVKYTAECEDYRGKRFTIKLDIPKMVDNRMLLRGNNKSIQTQLVNLPIIKTDFNTCQIISNYNKIFISAFNINVAGRSNPYVQAIIKMLSKNTDKNIKVILGDNSKVSDKYELPLDYIDLSTVYTSIETPNFVFYFDQDSIRDLYEIDESKGIPYAYCKTSKEVWYYRMTNNSISAEIAYRLCDESKELKDILNSIKWPNSGTYSRCKIYNAEIPLILVCCYLEGLSKTLAKAKINYTISENLPKEVRNNLDYICIKFSDGYLYTLSTYESNMLLNGLKDCSTELYSIADIDSRNTYYELLDDFGGKSRADGLDNFYDCMIDPITKQVLEHYKLPTDFITLLLYANAMLCDNKFIKHTDTSSRRIRRKELIAAYTYQALSEGYGEYSRSLKHGRETTINIKETAVIDKIMLCPTTSDDSTLNALGAVETTNAVSYKGLAGLNTDRAYSLDKRIYDPSMLNVLGTSTNFSAQVGITRQATMDMNVEGVRGYIKQINGDTNKMDSAKSLCATEGVTPFGTTHDDPMRTCMTFLQTAKHSVRTEESDPLLVTCGADEAMPYLTLDKFAFKSKKPGVVKEVTDDYIIVEYTDGTKEFVDLKMKVEKNSAGGFYVPLKLDKAAGISVGKKVYEGTILAYDKSSFSDSVGETDNIAYNIGKLVKAAIISTDDGFEDSGICTEDLSRSLMTKAITKVDHVIDKDCNVFYMAKVGDHVEPEDNLFIWQSAFDDEEANRLSRSLSQDIVNDSELGKKTIKSNVTGTIVDIKIYRTVDVKDLSPSLQKIVKNYEAPIKELKTKMDAEGIDSTSLRSNYKLDPAGKLKKAQEAILVEFYLQYEDVVAVGDKLCFMTANKCIVRDVLPNNLAPYTDFRPNEPIQTVISQVAVDKRLVTSTLVLGSINKLLVELDRSCKDILGIKYDDSKV